MFNERLAADEDGRRLGYAPRNAVLKMPFHERGQPLIGEGGYSLCRIDPAVARERGELFVEIIGPRLLEGAHDVPPVCPTELGFDFREVERRDGGLPRPRALRPLALP